MRHIKSSAVGLLAAFLLAGALSPSVAWAAPPLITGAACQPGQGVTVAVDYSLDGSDVDIRCAPGASGTILDAFVAAGFDVTATGTYVTAIGGIDPVALYGWEGFWGLYTSTSTGTAAGAPGSNWAFAQIGAGDGPVSTDQAYIFRPFETWDCMLLDYDPSYAASMADPTICDTKPVLSDVISTTGTGVVPPPPTPSSANPDAQAAAGWVGRLLADNGDVVASTGSTDWGTTIDAIFALASAGVGGDQIAATAAQVYASDTAYIGTVSQIGSKWSAIAKTILGLEVAGLDPTAFPTSEGPRNLIADLRAVLNADGSFGDAWSDSPFSHSLAILALARTNGGVPPIATTWLQAQQCVDATSPDVGSFGWAPDCSSPDPDSTALVIQALNAAGVSAGDATTWLAAQQDASGGFASWGALNTNTTGVATQALRASLPAVALSAEQFIGGVQITCATVLAHTSTLVDGNVGAIAYDQAGFDSAVASGLGNILTGQALRATVQAILGLGGPQFFTLSAAGAQAGLPAVPTCATTPPPPTPGPPSGPTVETGGSVMPQPERGLAVILLFMAAGAWAARRAVSRA